MQKARKYSIIDHGIQYCQYWQGYSAVFTRYAYCVTGYGMSAKEAYQDAVENIAQLTSSAEWERLHLPKRPPSICLRPTVPIRLEEHYWYVSILYNL